MEVPHKNKRIGGVEAFFSRSVLFSKLSWKDNQLNGLSIWYWSDGTIKDKISYKNNVEHGSQVEFLY